MVIGEASFMPMPASPWLGRGAGQEDIRKVESQTGHRPQSIPGTVYIAPPNRHLLVHPDGTLSLTQSQLVHFLRPSAHLGQNGQGECRRAFAQYENYQHLPHADFGQITFVHTTADLSRYVLSQQLLSQPTCRATPAYR
jgi:hypothetical protein